MLEFALAYPLNFTCLVFFGIICVYCLISKWMHYKYLIAGGELEEDEEFDETP